MEKSSRFVELSRYLQDPHLVARFQHICGVRGTFSGTVGSSNDADRTHSHNNGSCHHHITGESEGENTTDMGAGEGETVPAAAEGVRKRIIDTNAAKNHEEEGESAVQNGAVLSATTAAGETVAMGGNARSLAGSDPDFSGKTESGGKTEKGSKVPAHPGSSTLKPLRKNSLTGEAGQEFLIENRFFYYMFTFGTELGNELFYITFFPFIAWNLNAFVGRRLILIWVWVMYLGQCTKDLLGWSRPASPPVVKVEMFYNSEYSMPSTHAMSGTAVPFSLFFLTYGMWEDVIVGFLYSTLILFFSLPVLDTIDSFNLNCRYAPLIIISITLGLGLFSFTLDTWSTSRSDTAQILGVGAGIALASHVNHLLGLMSDPTPEQLPFAMPAFSASLVGVALLRLFLGVLVLMTTRALMKAVTIPLVCWVFSVPCDDVRKARQHMEVELPYRYIVYGAVGFNVLFLVPLLFSYLQLS
ncbi:sphingosine-1-phosphate phosphatase 1 isoform X2 [Cheilinus undulatus]|uniref:sphingosine-1-phosphate phosphatase 1 isoform X2 n=1 Tax=Cheilinus undulatus TaxID=241271 RepID=UPI001BD22C65|nr:sphingosine-1-phosphate phosphatase 1 isoform X2 [Cheilinus undulatus]